MVYLDSTHDHSFSTNANQIGSYRGRVVKQITRVIEKYDGDRLVSRETITEEEYERPQYWTDDGAWWKNPVTYQWEHRLKQSADTGDIFDAQQLFGGRDDGGS